MQTPTDVQMISDTHTYTMNATNTESYRRAEADTTQWEDIHSKHKTEGYEYVKGIKERQRKKRNEDWVTFHHDDKATSAREKAEESATKATADSSDDEDDFDDDEEEVMRRMRAKRLAQLKDKKQKERYGTVRYIHRGEFVAEVTKASENCPVVLFMYQDYIPECELLSRALNQVAARKKATKFLKIKATECVENFPDRSCPSLLVYNGGKMTHKFETLEKLGGKKVNADILEWALAQANACETTMEENPIVDHIIADAMEARLQATLE